MMQDLDFESVYPTLNAVTYQKPNKMHWTQYVDFLGHDKIRCNINVSCEHKQRSKSLFYFTKLF